MRVSQLKKLVNNTDWNFGRYIDIQRDISMDKYNILEKQGYCAEATNFFKTKWNLFKIDEKGRAEKIKESISLKEVFSLCN